MFNKSEIMKNAWYIYRDSKLDFMGFETQPGITFGEALKQSWAAAKVKQAQYAGLSTEEIIDKIETQMFYLDMKDRWEPQDHNQYDKWRRELNELRASAA